VTLEEKRQVVKNLVDKHSGSDEPFAWFEELYASAKNDPTFIPWARLEATPHLQEWLKTHQPTKENKSLTAVVVGCGLGDDAELLQEAGFQVTAFDISPTAINWCRQRFPNSKVNYVCGDVFQLPIEWEKGFDFVWECRTIQALPLDVREDVIKGVVSLLKPTGTLLLFTHYHTGNEPPSGPPWALSEADLAYFTCLGLKENEPAIATGAALPIASSHESKKDILLLDYIY